MTSLDMHLASGKATSPNRQTSAGARSTPTVLPIALTPEQASASLGISLSTFERHVEPSLPRIYIGSKLKRYRPEAIDDWTKTHEAQLP
jgi:hypothetical protein